jgi:hypothetical protein
VVLRAISGHRFCTKASAVVDWTLENGMLHRLTQLLAGLTVLGVFAVSSGAQTPQPKQLSPEKTDKVEVPRGLRPPAGMCRVWIDNVPAGRQPAPTDCANAIRNRPPNGRVIFSEEAARDAKPRTDDKNNPKREPPRTKKPPGSA